MLEWIGCETTCRKIPSFNFEFSFLVYKCAYKYTYLHIYDKTQNNTQTHPYFHAGRGNEKFPLSSDFGVKQQL